MDQSRTEQLSELYRDMVDEAIARRDIESRIRTAAAPDDTGDDLRQLLRDGLIRSASEIWAVVATQRSEFAKASDALTDARRKYLLANVTEYREIYDLEERVISFAEEQRNTAEQLRVGRLT